jgi:tetratricopeptide (TPR) repeat protein
MIGKTISHYEILEKLGEGGMGVVYKARDLDLDRFVAIKFLPQHLSEDDEARARFIHEAKAASALNHPNIGVVHEIGRTDDGYTFMVMACYDGESLRNRIDRGDIAVEEAFDIVSQVAAGLAKAHENEIVHRDMKPSNVLLTKDGHAIIIDFGLAKLAGRTKLTREGSTLGTAAYMSPEQAQGMEVDHRSDIFSVGTMLYEMLTGEPPFKGEHEAALLYGIVHENPVPLGSFERALPEDAQRVIDNTLAKDREQRYASAADMLADLKKLQEGSRVAALHRESRGKSRRAGVLYAAIGIVIIIAAYLGITRFTIQRKAEPDSDVTAISSPVVAVLPFTVRGGEEYADLGEGMVDLFSTKLDGAGELSCVEPQALMNYIEQQDESAYAPELIRRVTEEFAAGLYLHGNIMGSGNELHISASLYESKRGIPIAEAAAVGAKDQVMALVDDLAIQLLKGRLEKKGDFNYDLDAIRTESFEALKAYLAGDFNSALKEDSTFVHAWYRLALKIWGPMNDIFSARHAIDQAHRYRDTLPVRERLRVQALRAELYEDDNKAEELYRTFVSNYPDDSDGWHSLGRFLMWSAARRGRSPAEAIEPLERSLHLDPNLGGSLFNLIALSAFERKWDRLDTLMHRYAGGETPFIAFRAPLAFATGTRAEQDSIIAEISDLNDIFLMWSVMNIADGAADLERAQDAARVISDSERSDEMRGLGYIILAYLEAARGRWRTASEELERATEFNPPLSIEYHALLASVPFMPVSRDELREIRDRLVGWNAGGVTPSKGFPEWLKVHNDAHPHLRVYLLGLISIRLDDYGNARTYAQELEQMEGASHVESLVKDLSHGLRAQLAWEEGNLDQVLENFEQAQMRPPGQYKLYSPFYKESLERYLRAELLHEMGRHEEAFGWTSSFYWGWNFNFIYRAVLHKRYAEYYEEVGRIDEAIEHYSKFIETWKDCDEELQPKVNEAKSKLEALQARQS